MNTKFELHSDLKNLKQVGQSATSVFLLMDEEEFFWLIQVPKVENVKEVFELPEKTYEQVMAEANYIQKSMAQHFKADKMNIAALGNQTPQLHIHHVARFKTDSCWPKPVWGNFKSSKLSEEQGNTRIAEFKKIISKIIL